MQLLTLLSDGVDVPFVTGGGRQRAQLPRVADHDRRTVHRPAKDACHKGGTLGLPQAQGVGLGSTAKVPYIDVVVPAEQVFPGPWAQGDVAVASALVEQGVV